MEDCLFCMIAEGKIPSKKLYEDDQVVAFYDINPQAKVHFLVVPRKHISSAAVLTEEDGALLGHIFAVIAKLAKEQGLENGYRIISNVGEDAGQTVKHLHFHVLGGETLHVAGLTRELTICKVNDHMDIAAFIMLGDAELTVAAAAELLKKCPDFDILLTAEAKGIPLAHEMSRQSGKPYICARKGVKLYMPDPVVVEDQSITTAGKQKLVIDRKELEKMNGKRVLVVDDVISTGGSLKALDALAEKTQCTIVGQAAVLAEGDASERKDIIFLEPLPLFFH